MRLSSFFSSVVRQLLRFLGISLKQIRRLEDQIHGSAVTNPDLLVRPETVEDRESRPQMGANLQFAGCLTAVGVGHQQVGPLTCNLQVLKIANEYLEGRKRIETPGPGGTDGSLDVTPHAGQEAHHGFEV